MSRKADREALAIAHILGHASPEQMDEFTRLHNSDADFRAEVERIELWLAPLNKDLPQISAPDGLFSDITAEIEESDDASPTPATDRV